MDSNVCIVQPHDDDDEILMKTIELSLNDMAISQPAQQDLIVLDDFEDSADNQKKKKKKKKKDKE